MRLPIADRSFFHSVFVANTQAIVLAALIVLVHSRGRTLAETTEANPATPPSAAVADPFGPIEAESDPFETTLSDSPLDAAAYVPQRTRWEANQADFEAPAIVAPQQAVSNEPSSDATQPVNTTAKDPCAAAAFKPLTDLGIGIAQPAGQMPTDFATPCWDQINAGPCGACRCWPVTCYQWDATCLCYRPLYFEEINAERHGYVCDCCLQPAASAAHFFATVPLMPYYMAADCPGECVYTLGHYRPGSCPPWRHHCPPCDPVAAAGAGGIYTGLIFAIP